MGDTSTTMNELTRFVAEHGDDHFRARVARRSVNGFEILGILEEASLSHFALPETWLGKFAGGGRYVIFALDGAKVIGQGIEHTVNGPPSKPKAEVLNDTDWLGPKKVYFIDPGDKQPEPEVASTVTAQRPAMAAAAASATTPGDALTMAAERAQAHERELITKTQQLEIEKVQLGFATEKAKYEAKIEALAQQRTDEVRRLEEKINALANKPAAESPFADLKGLIPVAMTMLQKWMEKSDAREIEMLKMQSAERIEKMKLEDQRAKEHLESLEKAEARFERQQAEMRAEMKAMREEKRTMGGPETQMVESMSKMANTLIGTIGAMAELRDAERPQEVAGPNAGDLAIEAMRMVTALKGPATPAGVPGVAHQQARLPAPVTAPSQAFAGIQQQPSQEEEGDYEDVPVDVAFTEIETAIKQGMEPRSVAELFFKHIDDSDGFREAAEAAPDVVTMFRGRLEPWLRSAIAQRGPYLQAVMEQIPIVGKAQNRLMDDAPPETATPAQPSVAVAPAPTAPTEASVKEVTHLKQKRAARPAGA